MAKENGQVEEADMMEDSEIEKKIEEQAKDSNKELGLPALDADDGREDSEEDGEGGTSKASDPKTKKSKASAKAEGKEEDEEEMEEGELPPALKKAIAKKKGESDDDDEEKKEEIEVNVEEDVAALIDGEELSEAFKTKAATIFEAAVKSKISKIRKQIREESKKEQDERVESIQEEMTDNMDKYLNYAAKEWMEENKLSVETGVRNEVTESFITGLKKLFEEHYIDVPEEKEDVFESLVVEVAELEEKLDAQTEKHMDTVKELNTYKAASVFNTVSEGMVDTDVEKFTELTEDVDYDTDDQYAEKLNVIKNSYFKSDTKDVVDNKKTAGTNNPVVDGTSDSRMDSVMSAISHLSKK
jgi:hypothetical protein